MRDMGRLGAQNKYGSVRKPDATLLGLFGGTSALAPPRSSRPAVGVTGGDVLSSRREYGGLKSDQVKRMKDLEAENTRLRRAVSDLTLDKMILAEAARGSF